MKFKPLCLALATAGIMALANVGHAATIVDPIVKLSIGDEFGNNPQSYDFSPNLVWVASPTTLPDILLDTTKPGLAWHSTDGALFTIGNAKYDKDPLLNFSVTATNNSLVTKSYTFSFETPLVPSLTGLIDSHAEMTMALTAPVGGTASVQPLFGAGTMLKSYDLMADGSSISKNVDIGTLFTTTGMATSSLISATSSLDCGTVGCENMVSVLTFTLTQGASVTFSGTVSQIAAVPVPGAVWLFGSALAGLIGLRRKQQAA
jgi:hypothetical protein